MNQFLIYIYIKLSSLGLCSRLCDKVKAARESYLDLMFSESSHTHARTRAHAHCQIVRLLLLGNIISRRWADSVKALLSDCCRVFCRTPMELWITAPSGRLWQLNGQAGVSCGVNSPLLCVCVCGGTNTGFKSKSTSSYEMCFFSGKYFNRNWDSSVLAIMLSKTLLSTQQWTISRLKQGTCCSTNGSTAEVRLNTENKNIL